MPLIGLEINKKCYIAVIFGITFFLLFLYGLDVHHIGPLKRKLRSKLFYLNRTKISLIDSKGNGTLIKQPREHDGIKPVTQLHFLPNAILIGVRKGGTRALLRALAINPNIHTAPKEMHFFDRDDNYKKGIKWYRNAMPAVTQKAGQIIMEKTPSYFVTPSVPKRVYKMSKTIKLLVVVRNPTRRAISDYTQLKSKNARLPPFEEYITANKEQTVLKVGEACLKIGLYSKHLDNWLNYFPLQQFHFVSGKQLSINPVPELQAVEKFLNLESVITEKDFFFNKTKGFPCFKKHLEKSETTPSYSCLGTTKGRRHPVIRNDIIQLLTNYYRPYNKQFSKMVKRDFGWLQSKEQKVKVHEIQAKSNVP